MPLPSSPNWYLLFGATDEEIKEICLTTPKLYTRNKVTHTVRTKPHISSTILFPSLLGSMIAMASSLSPQLNYDHLEKEVERRKMFLQEAKLKAKGMNPDRTPALSALGGSYPGCQPCEGKLLFFIQPLFNKENLLRLNPFFKETWPQMAVERYSKVTLTTSFLLVSGSSGCAICLLLRTCTPRGP